MNKTPRQSTIVLSAGGTGGHLFPAEALARELLQRGHTVMIVTDKRGHAFKSLGDNVKIYCVRSGTLKAGITAKLTALFDMGIGLLQSLLILLRHRPAAVVGFGGYPSFPAVAAAQILLIPTLLHEQNAVLGKANLWLAPRARHIALSSPQTRGLPEKYKSKSSVTGNPVRKDILALRDAPFSLPAGTVNILVTGGSQGAHFFSELVPAAIALSPESARQKIFLTHQARAEDLESTRTAYRRLNIACDVQPFFGDMAARLKACHLFIGRSGASTVAEIEAIGRAALFVPHPGHADMQQKYNAQPLVDAGAAWLYLQPDLTPAALAEKIAVIIENPGVLSTMAMAAHAAGHARATEELADRVEKLRPGL